MTTTTKKTPGRPKKSPAQAQEQPKVVMDTEFAKTISPEIKHIQKQKDFGSVFTCIKGGITYMLPQSGITVFDEKIGQVREIRYCENMPSIYVDEQGEHARRSAVIFRDKNLLVPPTKPQLTEYLRAHPGNRENGGSLFYESRPQEKASNELSKEFAIVDAVSTVRDRKISELLPVAMMYGIDVSQQPSDIRYALLHQAKANPAKFMESFDSPMVKASAFIRQATDFQILRKKEDGYYWFDSNGLIVACPVGQDPVDVMTRFCMTERGAPVLMEIKDRLAKLD